MGLYATRAFKELGFFRSNPPIEILAFPLRGKGFKYVPNPPQVAKLELELVACVAAAKAAPPTNPKPK